MAQNFLLGKYWNPDQVMDAMKRLKEAGVQVYDVFSPFPIHGIEPYLNIKRSRLSIAAFVFGALGFLSAIALMGGIYGILWPMNIGGKPALAYPDFFPITFELTVLFSAHGMVITFFIVANYWPGKKVKLMDERQTDDVFVVAIDKSKIEDEGKVNQILKESEAFEIVEKEV